MASVQGSIVHELSIDFLLIKRSPISGWQSKNNAVNSRTSTHCLACFCEAEGKVTGTPWGIETDKVATYWKEYHVSPFVTKTNIWHKASVYMETRITAFWIFWLENSSGLSYSHLGGEQGLPPSLHWYGKWQRWKNTMAAYKAFKANGQAWSLCNKD